jgi:seryl-tRNA synthetase
MLDIKIIREHPEIVKKDLKKRREEEKIKWVDDLLNYDKKWRELIQQANKLRERRNIVTQEIAELKKKGKDVKSKVKEVKEIPDKIKKLEIQVEDYKKKANSILMKLPNILHESVPYGRDENDNVVVRIWSKPPEFNFKPKNHLDIAIDLGFIDTERAAKIAGRGFFYFKGELALLDYAIQMYTVQFMMKKGYTLIEPPFMMHREPYLGVTDLEFFGDQLYKIENEDLYLIATSEHPMAAMFMDEILDKKDLPIKFVGISPCFRKEVGAHGKYTKGLFRMHQFNKVEQFIFCLPEQSWRFHEELQKNSEELYQSLGLHYKVVNVCTGDIGIIAAKKYDILVWMADSQFREVGSNSNCTDYQARRLNIRFREKEGQAPIGFVHTLNNTALATSRTMMAILEQFQQKDGSVIIPKVLKPFMNGIERLEKH